MKSNKMVKIEFIKTKNGFKKNLRQKMSSPPTRTHSYVPSSMICVIIFIKTNSRLLTLLYMNTIPRGNHAVFILILDQSVSPKT